VRVEVSLPLPAVALICSDTAKGNEKHTRAWQGLHDGPIQTWEDFEAYPWPEITDDNFYIHRYICDYLPWGLGFITCHAGGVYEHASRLIGYENLCLMLYDDPELLKAVVDRLGELILEYNRRLLELDGLTAIFQGDDFGFNTPDPDPTRRHPAVLPDVAQEVRGDDSRGGETLLPSQLRGDLEDHGPPARRREDRRKAFLAGQRASRGRGQAALWGPDLHSRRSGRPQAGQLATGGPPEICAGDHGGM